MPGWAVLGRVCLNLAHFIRIMLKACCLKLKLFYSTSSEAFDDKALEDNSNNNQRQNGR